VVLHVRVKSVKVISHVVGMVFDTSINGVVIIVWVGVCGVLSVAVGGVGVVRVGVGLGCGC